MKIVHIMPSAPYNDYWGYQDNLLPKYQKKLKHDVTVIATNTINKDGKISEIDCNDYVLNDGVRVIRLKRKKYCCKVITNMRSKLEVYDLLCKINPDYIFFHGLVSSSIYDVVKYKKHRNCVVVQDNHIDYYNCAKTSKIKSLIIRFFYRRVVKKTVKYVDKVYGVTPWRQKYAEEYFKVPKGKTDILIMGADDEKIDFAHREIIRKNIRMNNDITDNDFLIVTGGKIDKAKNVIELMKACADLPNVKLLIFGSINADIKGEIDLILSKNKNIIYIGWISSDEVYDYFLAADFVCFPGTHSVLWEQACACKVPCMFKRWPDMEHLDNGGNSVFVDNVTQMSLKESIKKYCFTENYYEIKKNACSEKTDIYLYSKIAEKSLEVVRQKDE